MGCIHGKSLRKPKPTVAELTAQLRDPPASSPQKRIFDVETNNNNRDGQEVSLTPARQQGQLEITDESLIYRTRGRNPIIWPLRYLRKYGKGPGAEKDLFSFECGRHCTTGPGVFVFQCAETEQLFALLVETINKTSTQQQHQTLTHSSSQQSQSNSSRSHLAPITTPTSHNGAMNGVHSAQSAMNSQQSNHHLSSQHSENELLPEYVNIPTPPARSQAENGAHSQQNSANINASNHNNHGNQTLPRPRSSLDHQLSTASRNEAISQQNELYDGRERSSFDSSTLPHRRNTNNVAGNSSNNNNNTLTQSHTHPQMPLYVNSQTFDGNRDISEQKHKRANSSSFDDVSQYTNVAFFQRQLSKNHPSSQSQSSFDSPPNYIQLDIHATGLAAAKSQQNCSKNGIRSNSNGFTNSPPNRQSPLTPLNGTKSLSNLSRGGSPQRPTTSASPSNFAGSSNSLNRTSLKRPFVNGNRIRGSQPKITMDTIVPLPGSSYATIDIERTKALTQTQLNHQHQLACNGNY